MTSFRDLSESDINAHNAKVAAGRKSLKAPQNGDKVKILADGGQNRSQRQPAAFNALPTQFQDPLKLELPVPPTTNLAYRNMKDKGGRALSSAGRLYKELVRDCVTIQALQCGWLYPAAARLSLSLSLYFPTRQRRDISNTVKLIEDSIAEALGFDDRVVDILHVERKGYDALHPRCEVELAVLRET